MYACTYMCLYVYDIKVHVCYCCCCVTVNVILWYFHSLYQNSCAVLLFIVIIAITVTITIVIGKVVVVAAIVIELVSLVFGLSLPFCLHCIQRLLMKWKFQMKIVSSSVFQSWKLFYAIDQGFVFYIYWVAIMAHIYLYGL